MLSAIWGFAEARGNAWAMVPWLIAPLVLLIAVLLVMPTLTPARNRWRMAGGGIALALVFVIVSFAAARQQWQRSRRRASRAIFAGHVGPVAGPDRRRLAGLWRDQRRVALLAADRRFDPANVGKLRKVWEVHTRRAAQQPRLCQALRDREHAAEGRQPALHLHREERHHRARCGDRKAGVAGRSRRCRTRGSPTPPHAAALLIMRSPALPPNSTCAARIIEGTLDSRLIEVDALTGKPCTDFNGTGQQDTKIGMGWTPPGSVGINSAPTDRPRDHRRRSPDPRRPMPLRAVGRDPGLRRQDRQARLGVGHAASRLERLSAQGPDLGARDAQQLDDQRRRREARARLSCRLAMSPPITSRPAGRPRKMPSQARSSPSTSPPASRAGASRRSRRTSGTMTSAASRALIDYQGTPALLVSVQAGRSLCPRPRDRQVADARSARSRRRRAASNRACARRPRSRRCGIR